MAKCSYCGKGTGFFGGTFLGNTICWKCQPIQERAAQLREQYQHLSLEELLLLEVKPGDVATALAIITLVDSVHHLTLTGDEIWELRKSAAQAKKKAKLGSLKRGIRQKVYETHGTIPADDKREPIPEEVRNLVWNRDGGKCTKCGNREKLEFDHIVPIARGGSNTARNIELLCERCNREKSDTV